MSRDFIDEKAFRMAQDLDRGGGDLVAEKLRQDSIRLPEQDFARLVNLTLQYEQPGRGDDLQVYEKTGGAVVNVQKYLGRDRYGNDVTRSIPAGEICFSDIYDDQMGGRRGPQDGRPGHHGSQDRIDPKDVLLGAAIGFGIGKIIEHNNDKKDDRRRDDRRYPHR